MSVRLVILGLLRENPLYGYEIKQIIEEHMSDWTSIAFGSIYFALDKLAAENFVEKVSVEKEGRRPSRSVLPDHGCPGAQSFCVCCAKIGGRSSAPITPWIFVCSLRMPSRMRKSRVICVPARLGCAPRSNISPVIGMKKWIGQTFRQWHAPSLNTL